MMIECPGKPIAVTTCDILPEEEELHRLMEDYYHHAPMDFWFPAILAPEEKEKLGASAWKPRYRIAPLPGEPASTLLPGHLVIVDPEAVRLPLVYRTFDLAYKSRNRPILYRSGSHRQSYLWRPGFSGSEASLDLQAAHDDLHGDQQRGDGGSPLRQGVVTPEELAERLHRMFVRYQHRRRHPDRVGRLPLKHGLSMAKDIDTVEEAEEIAQEMSANSS